jgi:hypothetical protein
VHGLRRMYHGHGNNFVIHFGLFGDSINLSADRCTVCAVCNMGLEIILGTLDGTPR